MKNKLLPAATLVMLCACAIERVEPMNVPLSYVPGPRNTEVVGTVACNAIAQLQVTDARADKTLGERTHESKPLHALVTTSSDVASWAQQGLTAVLGQNGYVVQGSGPKVSISIDTLRTNESLWHRASYNARLALTGRVLSAAGNSCWSGTVQGAADNYGYAGSVVNYQQTLNSALDAAGLSLAQQQGFKDALCQCK